MKNISLAFVLFTFTPIGLIIHSPLLLAYELNVSRSGSDFQSSPVESGKWSDCKNRCEDSEACRSWTYVKPGIQGPNAVCWLKHSIPAIKRSSCCISGIKNAQYNKQVLGASIRRITIPLGQGASSCMNSCDAEAGCTGWNFTQVDPSFAGTCELLGRVFRETRRTGAVSGFKNMEYAMNRGGSDYKNFQISSFPSPLFCSNACEKDPACKSWTYVEPGKQGNKARCWLKNDFPRPEPNNCCVSGISSRHQTLDNLWVGTFKGLYNGRKIVLQIRQNIPFGTRSTKNAVPEKVSAYSKKYVTKAKSSGTVIVVLPKNTDSKNVSEYGLTLYTLEDKKTYIGNGLVERSGSETSDQMSIDSLYLLEDKKIETLNLNSLRLQSAPDAGGHIALTGETTESYRSILGNIPERLPLTFLKNSELLWKASLSPPSSLAATDDSWRCDMLGKYEGFVGGFPTKLTIKTADDFFVGQNYAFTPSWEYAIEFTSENPLIKSHKLQFIDRIYHRNNVQLVFSDLSSLDLIMHAKASGVLNGMSKINTSLRSGNPKQLSQLSPRPRRSNSTIVEVAGDNPERIYTYQGAYFTLKDASSRNFCKQVYRSHFPEGRACKWNGTAPFCRGNCTGGTSVFSENSSNCMFGSKVLCCSTEGVQRMQENLECRWSGTAPFCNGTCGAGLVELTRSKNSREAKRSASWMGIDPVSFGEKCFSGAKALCCQ